MFVNLGYWGLFIASFLSSTIVPMSSEVALVTLIALGLNPIWCVLIATLGNSLGGMTSYGLGYLGKWEWLEKYFRTPKEKVEKFQNKIQRWGPIIGLFAWLPFVGDLLAIGLGFMRLNPWLSCLYMAIGRLIRFSIVGGIMQLF
ncbi:MAG: DedA family protein [Bacteroidales bacterium]|nr:DedA family protein [Bacteroidales bacterium]MDD4739102.1 DedA family protein [Bacteroidales bacterium]